MLPQNYLNFSKMKKIVLVFISKGVGEIDWILPLLDRLSKNHIIFTYFRNKKSFNSIKNNNILYSLWRKNCNFYYIEKFNDRIFYKILKKINQNILKSKNIDIFTNKKINNIDKIEKFIFSKLLKKNYKIELIFSDFQENFLFLEKFKKLKKNRPIIIHHPHTPSAYVKRKDYILNVNLDGDLLFVGRKKDIPFFEKAINKKKIFPIGIPKFDKEWVRKILSLKYKNDLSLTISNLKKKHVITISYNSLFDVSDHKDKYHLLYKQLIDLMNVVSNTQNCFIIFSIHPKRNSKKFLKILSKYKKNLWCVSKMPLTKLASISDCFISQSYSAAGYDALNLKVPYISLPEIKGVDYEMSTNRKLGFCRVAKNKKDLSKLINLSKNKKNKFWYEQQTNFQKNYPNINKSTIKAFKIIAKKRNETM